MSERAPKGLSEPRKEEGPMNEEETRAFLREMGVPQFDMETWRTGDPVLYVVEERLRDEDGPFKHLPETDRPTIGRLDAPTGIVKVADIMTPNKQRWTVQYGIANEEGGRVDFYVLNNEGTARHVYTSVNPARYPDDPYYAARENLFVADDQLFPKGTD
jgi:hypothetical protein